MSAHEVADHFVGRIESYESKVRAFASFDADAVRAEAAQPVHGEALLRGLPVGIKDIFDTHDYPTEYYSPNYAGRRSKADAAAVRAVREAGACAIGKTHTAEFAYSHTGPTCNPHDLRRTPGSSSAGSAAGIAAGFFPIALGTQTAGSLIKPASYCGAFAFKPTYGAVSLARVKAFAPSFDTVGWFGRSVDDLELVACALLPMLVDEAERSPAPTLGFCRMSKWSTASREIQIATEDAIDAIRASGIGVVDLELSGVFDSIYDDHVLINDAEEAASLALEAEAYSKLLSVER